MIGIFEFLKEVFFCAGYIENKSFPSALSEADEREYIERYCAGDENAREKLIEHNLRLVVHIAKKYSHSVADRDDFISIGTIGLIKGVNTYDKTRSIRLATYVSRCIENEILMYLRKSTRQAGDIPLDEAVCEDGEGNTMNMMDIIGTDRDAVENEVAERTSMEKLRHCFTGCLSKREQVVIELRYGLFGHDIMPQREVAAKLGISRSYVSRIEKKALAKLQDLLEGSDEKMM